VRAEPDLFLQPGDTVIDDGDSWTANSILLHVDVGGYVMEVSES
jgi:hypothetical protein